MWESLPPFAPSHLVRRQVSQLGSGHRAGQSFAAQLAPFAVGLVVVHYENVAQQPA